MTSSVLLQYTESILSCPFVITLKATLWNSPGYHLKKAHNVNGLGNRYIIKTI